jgi:hypothetical protein
MKQYNIEEQLQRKLKDRAIAPSAEAWGRIAYNRQQQKKKKRYTGWYRAVAAALIISLGGLLLAALSNSTTVEMPQQTVTDQKTKPEVIEPAPENTLQQEVKNEVVLQDTKTVISPTAGTENAAPARQEVKMINTVSNAEIVKANEVAIAIHELALAKDGRVTDNEVDSLLHKAQREIAIERLKNKNLPTDDTALLNEAEKEMENSFRDKTLSIFKLKFKTIKIAFKDNQ